MHKTPKNIAILASGNGSTLEHIIAYQQKNPHAYTNKVVISDNKDAYALHRAANHHIEPCALTPHSTRDDRDAEIHNMLQERHIDIVILAGYMRILSASFCQKWAHKIVNIHPSLLPRYKGLNTYARALADYHKNIISHHGTSVHFVNHLLDGGALIAQGQFAITPHDTADTLEAKTKTIEQQLYPKIIADICLSAVKIQDNGSVTYNQEPCPKIYTYN